MTQAPNSHSAENQLLFDDLTPILKSNLTQFEELTSIPQGFNSYF